jgi:hypothetical protein
MYLISLQEITHYCRTALSRPVVTPNGTPIPPPRNVETKIKRMESNRMGFAKKSMSLPSRQPKKSSAVISSHEDQVPIIKKASRSAAPSPKELNIPPEWQKDDIIGKNGIKCSLFATQYDVEEIRERAMRPTLGTDGEVVDAYLVKWEGYDSSDNTWEPVNSMKSQVPNIVAAFEKSLEKSGKGRTPRASKAAKAVATSSSQKSHSVSLFNIHFEAPCSI